MSRSRQAPVSLLFSLRGRLLFLICLATLPAVLFTFFVAQNERSAVLARTERDALHLAGLASREHAHQIRGARDLLSWLGAKLVREGPRSPVISDPGFLGALLAGHPQLANIGVLSADGRVLTSAYPLASYRSWNDNPAYLAALHSRGVATGTYLVSPIFERPTLNHAYAVRGADDAVIGVLFTGLDLVWLSGMAKQSALPDGFSLLIVDRQGRVLASGGSTPADLARAGALRVPGISDLAQSRRGRMLATGGTGGTGGTGVGGYFVAAPLEETSDLFVAVRLPYDRVAQQANSSFYRTLAGLGALTLFIITAVFFAAELGILRNLRTLARVAWRFGAGDLSARANVSSSRNELSSLATAFNTMADSLVDRHRQVVDAQTRLRALAQRIQVARETEAARISRELHDEIGQVLTSLNIDLSRLQSCCPPDGQARPCATALREGAATMNQQIAAAVGFVRRISSDLRPAVLDKLGLAAALEWQAREVQARTGVVVQVEADIVDGTLDEFLAVTLFRIAQEALNNVVLHAQAHVVEIGLMTTGDDTILTVRDDGKGITVDAVQSSEALGIIGMRERAMLINGRLSIRGTPGQGTTVSVTVPRQPKPRVADARSTG